MNWHICHKRKLLFCLYFRHISLCFYSNFDQERSLDAEYDFASNKYPFYILLMDTSTPKGINTWKNVMMMSSSCFFRYLLFLGYRVCQKYAMWVLVGFIIKFHIQRYLLIKIWVKTQEDMSKIQTQKIVFFNNKYVNSTIMVDSFYWNSIGSWIPTHKIYCWFIFL